MIALWLLCATENTLPSINKQELGHALLAVCQKDTAQEQACALTLLSQLEVINPRMVSLLHQFQDKSFDPFDTRKIFAYQKFCSEFKSSYEQQIAHTLMLNALQCKISIASVMDLYNAIFNHVNTDEQRQANQHIWHLFNKQTPVYSGLMHDRDSSQRLKNVQCRSKKFTLEYDPECQAIKKAIDTQIFQEIENALIKHYALYYLPLSFNVFLNVLQHMIPEAAISSEPEIMALPSLQIFEMIMHYNRKVPPFFFPNTPYKDIVLFMASIEHPDLSKKIWQDTLSIIPDLSTLELINEAFQSVPFATPRRTDIQAWINARRAAIPAEEKHEREAMQRQQGKIQFRPIVGLGMEHPKPCPSGFFLAMNPR